MPARVARGFTLVESVVALAVLSMGMLGATRLLSEALQSLNSDATWRTAIVLADDLADLLIANRAIVAVNHHGNCRIGHSNCFRDVALSAVLLEWHTRMQQLLPAATAHLNARADDAMLTVIVSLRWPNRYAGLATHEFEIVFTETQQ